MSARPLRKRISYHLVSFKSDDMNQTELSKLVHDLKSKNIDHEVEFELIENKPSYTSSRKNCQLCIAESYNILFKGLPNMINSKVEIIGKCRHRAKFKLNRQMD